MYKYIFLAALLPLALIIVACTTEIEVEKIVEVTGEVPVSSATVATEPRKLNLLVGSGRDTEAILQFFPRNLTVRVGDSVTWKIDTDEIHPVGFFGGGGAGPAVPGAHREPYRQAGLWGIFRVLPAEEAEGLLRPLPGR